MVAYSPATGQGHVKQSDSIRRCNVEDGCDDAQVPHIGLHVTGPGIEEVADLGPGTSLRVHSYAVDVSLHRGTRDACIYMHIGMI